MEATISFIGFGIPPPQPSWRGMLNLEGRKYMLQAPGWRSGPVSVLPSSSTGQTCSATR